MPDQKYKVKLSRVETFSWRLLCCSRTEWLHSLRGRWQVLLGLQWRLRICCDCMFKPAAGCTWAEMGFSFHLNSFRRHPCCGRLRSGLRKVNTSWQTSLTIIQLIPAYAVATSPLHLGSFWTLSERDRSQGQSGKKGSFYSNINEISSRRPPIWPVYLFTVETKVENKTQGRH